MEFGLESLSSQQEFSLMGVCLNQADQKSQSASMLMRSAGMSQNAEAMLYHLFPRLTKHLARGIGKEGFEMHLFEAELEIIGINPYVSVPVDILEALFKAADKRAGPIPIQGTLNGQCYRQTLVKFKGKWRLYVNTTMLPHSPLRIGERIAISVAYDPEDRTIAIHPKLLAALNEHPDALKIFETLTPSMKKEIIRYIAQLKTEASVDRNVARAIRFLRGEERFIGRDHP